MTENIITKLNLLSKSNINKVYIRMYGEQRQFKKQKIIYLLLKPLFQKYSMESGINYDKEIPLNVKKYYELLAETLGQNLEEYHIPYEILKEDGKYIFKTEYWGRPLNYSTITHEQREAGENWAKQKLRELHNKGLIHGDLINEDSSGRIVINRGNILFNEDMGEYRFIDMGFDKFKKNLEFKKKNLQDELEREKQLLERYEKEYVKSAKKDTTKFAQLVDDDPYKTLNPDDIF